MDFMVSISTFYCLDVSATKFCGQIASSFDYKFKVFLEGMDFSIEVYRFLKG